VEPFEAGIGGGGFMVIYLKAEDRVITIDGREKAPLSASTTLFRDPDSPEGKNLPLMPNRISNGAAVGVPGTLLTWTEALNRYGTLSLDQVLKPSITLAEKGFTVNPTFARFTEQNQARFGAFTSTRDLYLKSGRGPQVGSNFTNPDLAKTYRLVAQKGPNVFYRGEIGKAIIAAVQQPPTVKKPPFRVIPGGMTMTDLDYYDVQIRPPVTTDYRGYKVYGMGLPSSGGVTSIQALNLAEGYNLSSMDRTQALHSIIESDRLAYADRSAYLGDPEFVDVPVAGLLSPAYAQERRRLISDQAPEHKQATRAPGDPFKYQQDPSPSRTAANRTTMHAKEYESLTTAHLTVGDRFGNVVSYTLTIEQLGGSGIVVPGYGFLLNNELTDFNLDGPNPNSPEPGKRPLSSMAPTLIFAPDGRVIAFGSPGGSTIITTVLGITFNLIDFNMTLDQAIAAPRLSQRNSRVTQVDSGLEKTEIGKSLTALGHVLEPIESIGAATGIILYPDARAIAAAEPVRRGGGSAIVVKPTPLK
jgi:gamma-glutamyltranspeptidase/glutathione hydrolase